MKELLYVFIGGGIGSSTRFTVSMLWKHLSLHPAFTNVVFPWPTFIVNVMGCFLISLFYLYSDRWGLSPEMRLLLTTGLCGGFTTFSTFSMEGLGLITSGNYHTYVAYLVLSIVLGLVAAAIPMLPVIR